MSILGEMAGGFAHEINNPLAVINGMLDHLGRLITQKPIDEAITEKANDRIEKSKHQVQRIVKIISGLREFSRDDQSKDLEKTTFSKIMDVASVLLTEKLTNGGIKLTIESHSDCEFKANQIQIEQVLVNLIGNAGDAIESLQEKWIKVSAVENGVYFEISVTDSGHGISKDIEEKMMRPFFTTKPIGKGTGLGLSISRSIVEQHCGVLFLDRACPNTKFTIRLPLEIAGAVNLFDFDTAIQSHLNWRQTFTSMLSGTQPNINIDKISCPAHCELGKWISSAAKVYQNDKTLTELKEVHAAFHECAGEVATSIKLGDASVNSTLFDSGSKFDELSKKVLFLISKLRDQHHNNTSKAA